MVTYLVTQATGQQSQSVIMHLLEAGETIHAVVRDLQKIPPGLKKPGVKIFKGESTNFEEIFQAAQGCRGAFLNTFPWAGLEAQQAKTIVEACKKAGVESVVASTTFATDKKTMWDDHVTEECGLHQYFLSKAEVEDAVRHANFKAYTILRPSVIHFDFLMPGVLHNFPGLPARGELDHAFNDGVRMPFTDADDIGKYATAALRDPAKFGNQEIDLANELLTMEEVRDILAKISGRDVRVRKRSPAEIEDGKINVPGIRFHLWANVKDLGVLENTNKEVQAKFGIPFTSLEMALQRDKVRLLECLPA